MEKKEKTLLQVAIDLLDLKLALKLALISVKAGADIIEAGTPLIKKYGMLAVEAIKGVSEKNLVVADLKTLDTGYLEAKLAYESGADIVTVSGLAPLETINEALKAAKEYDKMVCVDLLGTSNLETKMKSLRRLKDIDFYLIHLGIDQQKRKEVMINHLKYAIKFIDKSKLAVAGGINQNTINQILAFNPRIVIVGSAIYKSPNPRKTIEELLSIIRQRQ